MSDKLNDLVDPFGLSCKLLLLFFLAFFPFAQLAVAAACLCSIIFDEVHRSYGADSWEWVRRAYADRYGKVPGELSGAELAQVAEDYAKVRTRFLKAVLIDAKKEFDESARIGFGLDGTEDDREADFVAVRGTFEEDKFVTRMRCEMEELEARVAIFAEAIRNI